MLTRDTGRFGEKMLDSVQEHLDNSRFEFDGSIRSLNTTLATRETYFSKGKE